LQSAFTSPELCFAFRSVSAIDELRLGFQNLVKGHLGLGEPMKAGLLLDTSSIDAPDERAHGPDDPNQRSC
jgi:hypothetical protein